MGTTLETTARIEIIGANPYVLVTAAQAATVRAGWRKPMPVLVRINDQAVAAWRTNMMPTGHGDFRLYLHGEMRAVTRTEVDDVVTIELTFDEQYRNGPLHPVPADLQAALEDDRDAAENWRSLTPSRQKEILRYFAALKSPEAQNRNVARIVKILKGEPDHFMGRDWLNGK
jgi:hypothetical protein